MLLPCLGEMCASRNIGVRVSLINTVLLLLLLLLLFNIYPKITLLPSFEAPFQSTWELWPICVRMVFGSVKQCDYESARKSPPALALARARLVLNLTI